MDWRMNGLMEGGKWKEKDERRTQRWKDVKGLKKCRRMDGKEQKDERNKGLQGKWIDGRRKMEGKGRNERRTRRWKDMKGLKKCRMMNRKGEKDKKNEG